MNSSVVGEFNGRYWKQPIADSRTRKSTREGSNHGGKDDDNDDNDDENESSDSDNSSTAWMNSSDYIVGSGAATSYYCSSFVFDKEQPSAPEAAAGFSRDLEDVIICKICKVRKHQIIIPCGHSFCEGCVKEGATTTSNSKSHKLVTKLKTDRLQFTCPSCAEVFSLKLCLPHTRHGGSGEERQTGIQNKVINDIYDALIDGVKNPCEKHSFMSRTMECNFCQSDKICPICYTEIHFGHNELCDTVHMPLKKWPKMFPILLHYLNSNRNGEPPSEKCLAKINGTERIDIGGWFLEVCLLWSQNKLDPYFIEVLTSLSEKGLLNLESQYFSAFCIPNSSHKRGIQYVQSPISKKAKRSRLIPTSILTNKDSKMLAEGINVVYRYITVDLKAFIAIGRIVCSKSSNVCSILWKQPVNYRDVLSSPFIDREDIITEVDYDSILLIGLVFDKENKLCDDSCVEFSEFRQLNKKFDFEPY